MKQTLTYEEISSFSLELSLLLHAGVTVGDALALLADESGPDYHDLLDPMAQAVDDGASLSQALRQSGAFPVYVWRWGSAPAVPRRPCGPFQSTMRAAPAWAGSCEAPCCIPPSCWC